jgi:exopolyphosphatase / guanosine-5'-triphosphate,3'-diphosphate pyrophosphatase
VTSQVRVHLGIDDITVLAGEHTWALPVGHRQLCSQLDSDPPRPEELVNAIGLVSDHLDDVVHSCPDAVHADTVVSGHLVHIVAAVEVGAPVSTHHFELSRAAAEDVFRTLATEPRATRRLNPGLPAEHVDEIVATCCALVAVLRRLQLDRVLVAIGSAP